MIRHRVLTIRDICIVTVRQERSSKRMALFIDTLNRLQVPFPLTNREQVKERCLM